MMFYIVSITKYIFCLRFRRCCDAGCEEPSWRDEVTRTLRDGARSIVDSLLRHPDSRHYRHDHLHDLHVSLQAAAEANTLPVTKNLCSADQQSDTIETAATANIEHTHEEDCEDSPDDNSSYVSLNSTLPSSLLTDAPPSVFSFSSYESDSPEILSPDKIDLTKLDFKKLNKCKVSLKKMTFYSWSGKNEDPLKSFKKEDKNDTFFK